MKIILIFLGLCTLGIALPAIADDAAPAPVAAAAQPAYLFELSYSDAEVAIGQALAEKGAGGKISASIVGRKTVPIFAYSKPLSVEIHGLQFDKTGHWSASLLFKSEEQVVSAIPAAGRFEEMIEAPVLKRQVRNGDVISDNDIEMRDFPILSTRNDTITKVADLVGKSPERTISPGRPVREHEIANPAVVKKNALVEMHYSSPGMEITASGQAMENGAKGDVISVRNTVSKKIIQAVVQDERTVAITVPGTQVSQLTGDSHATN